MIEAALRIATLGVGTLLGGYALLFLRFPKSPKDAPTEASSSSNFVATQALSVLICAHNEAAHLEAHLPHVLQQDYCFANGSPAFEVIVADDASTDETPAVLERLCSRFPHLRVVRISPEDMRIFPGKKFPLSCALKAARHPWLVCTDADCAPAGPRWLQHLAKPLAEGREIVAGYGGMRMQPGAVGAFSRRETQHTFLQYYSFWRLGLPYMAVGRNLATTQAMLLKAQSAEAWKALPSGDDDLLVQLCATPANMCVLTHPDSFTWTMPKSGLRAYLAQKQRHVSTSKFYALRTKWLPGLYALTHAAWWLLFVLCIALLPLSWPLLAVLWLPMLLWLWAMGRVAWRLGEGGRPWGWLGFSFCWVLYNAVLAPFMLWKTRHRWQ